MKFDTKKLMAAMGALIAMGGGPGSALRATPAPRWSRAERLNAQSKRFSGNGPREVARRVRQIDRLNRALSKLQEPK